MADIAKALPFMLQNEGGYTNNPHDHGGPTNYGITLATLASWRHKPVTAYDVKHISMAEVEAIYKHDYWDMLDLDHVESQGVATACFDMAVNFGVGGCRQLISRTCAVLRQTSIDACQPAEFLHAFEHLVEERYTHIVNSNPSQHVFYKGWMARAHRLLSLVS